MFVQSESNIKELCNEYSTHLVGKYTKTVNICDSPTWVKQTLLLGHVICIVYTA